MNQTLEATRASLILRLRSAEDVAAWDEFVGIYTPVIFRVATNRGLQAADAENLVQEVFLAVANSVATWLERDDRGRFRAWLLRIARNEAVDMLTGRTTRPLGLDGSAGDRLIANMAGRDELSSAFELEYERTVFRWASHQVRAAVAEQTWDAFWLSSVDGLPVGEVSQRLGMRAGNVYLARSRVMSRIKELVKKYEDQE